MSPSFAAEPIFVNGLLKTFKDKGGGFSRENQTVDK